MGCEARRQCTNVFEPHPETRATPVTYADERNLRLKRREFEQVKAADTLDQNGKGVRASSLTHRWGFFHQAPGV